MARNVIITPAPRTSEKMTVKMVNHPDLVALLALMPGLNCASHRWSIRKPKAIAVSQVASIDANPIVINTQPAVDEKWD